MTPEQRAAICDYYGVNGWKKGQTRRGGGHDTSGKRYKVSPPDLDSPAGAWALLVALVLKGSTVAFDYSREILIIDNAQLRHAIQLSFKDHALSTALQRAAWDAIPEEAKHAS